MSGDKIAETGYWDLRITNIIACPQCRLIQLDPMLSEEEMHSGCYAYHLMEEAQTSPQELAKNLVRNYRRGILFAMQIKKKGFQPSEILEYGPGSGYFTAGVQFVFPKAKVTIVDLVDEVIEQNRNVHGFLGFKGTPETFTLPGNKQFDLVIARDILEHVSDIGCMIRNVSALLNPGGLFHFLTPNGREDVWKHHVTWSLFQKPSQLLINHVNYFDGKGSLKQLHDAQFHPIKYYTYQLKTTWRGKGWSMRPGQAEAIYSNISAEKIIEEHQSDDNTVTFKKEEILNHWYLTTRYKWITYLYCLYMHEPLIKVNPAFNIGHEIYGLFTKQFDRNS
ncbi:MAG: class I SAM-dependent methyltransferase [Bacteroidota bacterium]